LHIVNPFFLLITDNSRQNPTYWACQVKHSGHAIIDGGDGGTLLLLLLPLTITITMVVEPPNPAAAWI